MDAEPHPSPVRPLAAFSVPNFRRFTIGQTISLVGSWTEPVAQAILVLRLTHSGVWLGLATAARYAPVLLRSILQILRSTYGYAQDDRVW